jgi:hypothetical protein
MRITLANTFRPTAFQWALPLSTSPISYLTPLRIRTTPTETHGHAGVKHRCLPLLFFSRQREEPARGFPAATPARSRPASIPLHCLHSAERRLGLVRNPNPSIPRRFLNSSPHACCAFIRTLVQLGADSPRCKA